ncbi:MAG TPA: hypothetical protein EYP28_06505 [Methanophagales archaeon]|nr:hypothetical protein [Methanophagales archaeon]
MKKIIIFVVIFVLIIIGLLASGIMVTEEVPIIKVKAEVTVTDDKPTIKIVSVEQDAVNPLKSPRGNSAEGFPGVDALAIVNNRHMSYWAAVDYHGNGTYDLVIGFHRDVIPKQGDTVKVIASVVDKRGNSLAKNIKVIKSWE